MKSTYNQILSRGQLIDDKYSVAFFLKKGSYAETYCVKEQSGKTQHLKLFIYSKLKSAHMQLFNFHGLRSNIAIQISRNSNSITFGERIVKKLR